MANLGPRTRLGRALAKHGETIDRESAAVMDPILRRYSGWIGIVLGIAALLLRPAWPIALLATAGLLMAIFGIVRDRFSRSKK